MAGGAVERSETEGGRHQSRSRAVGIIGGAGLWLVAGVALCACSATKSTETGGRLAADGTACPDVRRPLPFPVSRPDCWNDEEWAQYLEIEANRARNGDRYNEWSWF